MSVQPLVSVIMGSKSDWETMAHTVETLEKLGVPCEARREAGLSESPTALDSELRHFSDMAAQLHEAPNNGPAAAAATFTDDKGVEREHSR